MPRDRDEPADETPGGEPAEVPDGMGVERGETPEGADVDLAELPDGTGAVLAALAARDATDRQSALPETLIAAEAGRDRETVAKCCDALVAGEFVERVRWSDAGEELAGYHLIDHRVKEQGLRSWRQERTVDETSA